MKRKITLSGIVLLFFVLCVSCTSTNSSQTTNNADGGTSSEIVPDYTAIFKLELVDEGDDGSCSYTINGYTGYSPMVVIPENINGIPVKRIGERAFTTGKSQGSRRAYKFFRVAGVPYNDGTAGNTNIDIVSVTIPNSVIEIGNGAFANCGFLKSIILPKNLNEIEANTFLGCYGLLSIKIPDYVYEIGTGAFGYCSALESVTLPENIECIESYAFISCRNLRQIIIPENVSEIDFGGDDVFKDCTSLSASTKTELTRRGYVF